MRLDILGISMLILLVSLSFIYPDQASNIISNVMTKTLINLVNLIIKVVQPIL